jgi:hypothetical protein
VTGWGAPRLEPRSRGEIPLARRLVGRGVLAVMLAAATTWAGCASAARDDRTPTGGRSLSIQRWMPAERKIVFYEVDRNGVFGTSGGVDAEIRQATWTTPLDAETLADLLDPPSAASWWATLGEEIDRAGSSRPDASSPRTMIRFIGPTLDRERTYRGTAESVESLIDRLREIAMARFEETLDALPRAGERFPN